MSLPWIKVYTSLPRHPKMIDLGEATGVVRAWTHVVELWAWFAEFAPTGLVVGGDDRLFPGIARASGWTGDLAVWFESLLRFGLLNRHGNGVRVHDWDEHQ